MKAVSEIVQRNQQSTVETAYAFRSVFTSADGERVYADLCRRFEAGAVVEKISGDDALLLQGARNVLNYIVEQVAHAEKRK